MQIRHVHQVNWSKAFYHCIELSRETSTHLVHRHISQPYVVLLINTDAVWEEEEARAPAVQGSPSAGIHLHNSVHVNGAKGFGENIVEIKRRKIPPKVGKLQGSKLYLRRLRSSPQSGRQFTGFNLLRCSMVRWPLRWAIRFIFKTILVWDRKIIVRFSN